MSSILELATEIVTVSALFIIAILSMISLKLNKYVTQKLSTTTKRAQALQLSLILIIGLTLGGRHWSGTQETYWLLNGTAWSQALLPNANALLNAILFVPAGVSLGLIFSNKFRVFTLLSLLSLTIEHLQMLTGWGAADAADLTWNTFGALFGAYFAIVLPKKKDSAK